MRQAIVTRFIGPTNHRGSRVVARCEAGKITLGWDDALDVADNHKRAAVALAARLGWIVGGEWRLVDWHEAREVFEAAWHCGSLPIPGWAYCFVAVAK